MSNYGILDLVVLIERRIGNSRGNRNRATGAIVNIGNVVVDDRLPLADDANRSTFVLVIPQKEVSFNKIIVAVAESECSCRIAKCVVAIGVVARFVRDDFDFAIKSLEEIVFYGRVGIARGFVARAQCESSRNRWDR